MAAVKVSPREIAFEKLLFLIVKNNYPPHFKLPSERELSERWGLNRMTLRSAIDRLIAENVLYSKGGSGTYVAEPKLVRDLHYLSSLTSQINKIDQTLRTRFISLRIVESTKKISIKLKVPIGTQIYELIRLRIINDIPATLETIYLPKQLYPNLERFDFGNTSLYDILEKNFGVIPDCGQESISVTYVTEEEASLLEINEGDPIFFITGATSDVDGSVIEYYRSLFRNDRFVLTTTSIIKEQTHE